MTVCLAAIYGKDEGIIAVADKMFTSAPGIVTVHEVNENNKITKLTDSCIAMMAGNVINASSIIGSVVSKVSNESTVEEIANVTAKQYRSLYRKAVESEALSRWGLNLDDFVERQQSLDKNLVDNLNKVISDSSLEVEIIVAGKDKNGNHLYVITNPGAVNCLDSIGIAYAGSGAAHASLSIVDSQHQKSDAFGKVLFDTFKAKKRAEYDPNVGKYTSVCTINSSVKEFSDEEITKLYDYYVKNQENIRTINDKVIKDIERGYNGDTSSKK